MSKTLTVKYAELGVTKPAKQYLIQVVEPEELVDSVPVVYEFDYNKLRELYVIPETNDYSKLDWESIHFEALKKTMLEIAKNNGFDDVKLIHCKIRMIEP